MSSSGTFDAALSLVLVLEEMALQACTQAPLLVASGALACIGVTWVFFLLLSAHPWLLPLLASATCLLLHVLLVVRRRGIVQLLPGSVVKALNAPAFELVHWLVHEFMVPAMDWLRLVVLATVQLDDEYRKQILMEMRPAFRHAAFRQPLVRTMPTAVQGVMLGEAPVQPATPSRRATMDEIAELSRVVSGATMPETASDDDKPGPAEAQFTSRKLPLDRACSDFQQQETEGTPKEGRCESVEDLMQLVRNLESNPASGMPHGRPLESTMLHRIINEKIADQAAVAFVQGSMRQYNLYLRGPVNAASHRLNSLQETVLNPPAGPLRIPWEMARMGLKLSLMPLRVARSVATATLLLPVDGHLEDSVGSTACTSDLSAIGVQDSDCAASASSGRSEAAEFARSLTCRRRCPSKDCSSPRLFGGGSGGGGGGGRVAAAAATPPAEPKSDKQE